MAAVSKGAAGEVLAARFLRERGYDILTANYRTRLGEIDIIAADKQYIAFVEVKTRNDAAIYAPRSGYHGKAAADSAYRGPFSPAASHPLAAPF